MLYYKYILFDVPSIAPSVFGKEFVGIFSGFSSLILAIPAALARSLPPPLHNL